ncbi:type I restriction endonuclease subunit R, partial [Actinocrinis puniceicyclus]
SPTPDTYATAYLWRQIWHPDNWLEIIERYIHVEPASRPGTRQDPHKAPLIFPRYHQWHAVQRMVAHAQTHGSGANYLIEHSAGSGKSNTIAWLSHRLSRLHTPGDATLLDPSAREAGLRPNQPVFDKVIVITDRLVLDQQLQDTIYQFEHVPGVVKKIDEDSTQLADALTGSTARIIITTLQKFPYILGKVAALRDKRYAIVIDEAHSSQSGESAAALKRALGALSNLGPGADEIDEDGDVLTASALARGRHPNLSYFAFTATPKHKTLLLFGTPDPADPEHLRPFHTYSMRQAIDEGFILDVLANYITYQTRWRLRNAAIEQAEQSAIANPEVDPRKAKAALVRLAELHPSSQDQRAKIIVDHFRAEIAGRLGGRAKAMVVTRSREHALRLYQAISKYVAQLEATDCTPLVAFSGKLTVDDVDYTETQLNGFGEAALPGKFDYTAVDDKDAAVHRKTEYRILVVAEKYQTGFDQPLLTAMYVDKPLKDVAAVQTLSRLNRTHPAKTQADVFVLDFANEATAIQEAFRPYFETTITEPEDPNLLYDKQREAMDFRLLVVSEMDAFVRELEAARRADPLLKDTQIHARLYRYLQPAVDRFTELAEADRENAEEFRSALSDYVRAYGLLAQVVGFADEDLERLYQYGRVLLNRLPRRPGPSVDIGDTDLSHLALNKIGQERLSLSPSGDQLIPGFSLDGGAARRVEEEPLSEVIEELNRKFGLDLGTAHQLLVVQQIVTLAENPRMQQIALMNDEEKFNQVADGQLDQIVGENMDRNAEFGRLYFDNPEFKSVLRQTMRKRAFQLITSPMRDEAISRMRALRDTRTGERTGER